MHYATKRETADSNVLITLAESLIWNPEAGIDTMDLAERITGGPRPWGRSVRIPGYLAVCRQIYDEFGGAPTRDQLIERGLELTATPGPERAVGAELAGQGALFYRKRLEKIGGYTMAIHEALGNADEVLHAREMMEKVNQWRAKEARAHLASRAATAA